MRSNKTPVPDISLNIAGHIVRVGVKASCCISYCAYYAMCVHACAGVPQKRGHGKVYNRINAEMSTLGSFQLTDNMITLVLVVELNQT